MCRSLPPRIEKFIFHLAESCDLTWTLELNQVFLDDGFTGINQYKSLSRKNMCKAKLVMVSSVILRRNFLL